jgi:hypothetical protein
VPTKKPRFIRPPDDLRRRAVNATRGLNMELTDDERTRIETAVHRSKDKFVSQIAEKLKSLRAGQVEVERRPDTIGKYLDRVRDESLAVKGLGGTFGYPLVTTIAGNLNDFVLKLKTANKPQLLVVRHHIDAIYVILARQMTTMRPETEGELVASLKILTAKFA